MLAKKKSLAPNDEKSPFLDLIVKVFTFEYLLQEMYFTSILSIRPPTLHEHYMQFLPSLSDILTM